MARTINNRGICIERHSQLQPVVKYRRDDRFFFLHFCLFLNNGCKDEGFAHVKVEVFHPLFYIFFSEIFEGFFHNPFDKVIGADFSAVVIGIGGQITLEGVCVDTKPLEKNLIPCKTEEFVAVHDTGFCHRFRDVVEIVSFQDLEGVYVPLSPAHLCHDLNDGHILPQIVFSCQQSTSVGQ
ncbi:MAG: hypothetical protein A4E65_03138 [Syntrophorhabdus sp. PtaU1.Bin153]|nr:MAG: hypothetical protein A4E65_03138 [Syntrophorhabdus sp. PtaU1.Bin153]